jgi:hypothetical protein
MKNRRRHKKDCIEEKERKEKVASRKKEKKWI